MSEPPAPGVRVRLWDLPTRLIHWSLVALVAFSWWSAEEGEMELHRYSGYAVLALLVFRLYWGFAGSSTARFAGFVKGPAAVAAHLRSFAQRGPSDIAGHNPLGALSVLALLAALIAQVGFGLFAVDVDGLESGPLSHLVDFDTGRVFAELHETSFNVLLVLIGLHLAAIAFYLVYKRDNLVRPMVTGWRTFSGPAPAVRFAPAWRILVGVVLAAAAAWAVARGFRF
ncbi:MAG: cytochrome b/b6 domain-containing protein [Phenylobacterium sp.]|uniref:cytochrome b/b6 domain-containing protein n=1 Tax=Phenylobacterium sp. TaxID=1871053 RepID=UPI00391AFCA2